MDVEKNIRELFESLFPTGRAWNYTRGSEKTQSVVFVDGNGNTFVDGSGAIFVGKPDEFISILGKTYHNARLRSFDRAFEKALSLLNVILPDNNSFDENDALNWERIFGLKNSALTLEQRKTALYQKFSYPNDVVERSHYSFIQEQLQAAGFNVHVYENRFFDGVDGYEVYSPTTSILNEFTLGQATLGSGSFGDFSLIGNYINEDLDAGINVGVEEQLAYSFFIGGDAFPNPATVQAIRKNEFRDLILKLKPCHTVGFLLINYI